MSGASGQASSSAPMSGELLDPMSENPQRDQSVFEVDKGIQDAASNLSLGGGSTLPISRFLVGSDVSAMAAPSQEVKRSLFGDGMTQFGSSLGSTIKSGIFGSAKRDSMRTPGFGGFGRRR